MSTAARRPLRFPSASADAIPRRRATSGRPCCCSTHREAWTGERRSRRNARARAGARWKRSWRGIDARAFRFAELGLRHREDALDAVQDAMLKMLAYRDRPASEWTPLFWSILRSRIVDMQRRGLLRLRWLLPGSADRDGEALDWADDAPDPSRNHDGREAWARIGTRPAQAAAPASAKPSPCACWRSWTWPTPPAPWAAARAR